ncbi:MAG: DUF4097 family beta strand repeat protein [Candidatus Delongbacteria bacterium]|nr:DUF4097 family beta strand repeat protein [Candidatus Delongbacteria bacterium]MBN2835866.1 DUF4097 family beta strand repeat protein [Candidatus Delongbacteria bacterium]
MNCLNCTDLIKEEKKFLIDISIHDGDISIMNSENDDIAIEFHEIRKGSIDEYVDFSLDENGLKLKSKKKDSLLSFKNLDFGFDLKIPKSLKNEITLKNFNGELEIKGVFESSKFFAELFNGDCSIKGIHNSKSKLKLFNGDLEVDDFSGTIEIDNMNGDVSIDNSVVYFIKVKCMNGDVKVDNVDFNLDSDCKISTMSGDINVDAKSCTGEGKLLLKTLSGDVDCEGICLANLSIENISNKFGNMFEGFQGLNKGLKGIFKKVYRGKGEGDTPDVVVKEQDENKNSRIDKILSLVESGKISASEATDLIKAIN